MSLESRLKKLEKNALVGRMVMPFFKFVRKYEDWEQVDAECRKLKTEYGDRAGPQFIFICPGVRMPEQHQTKSGQVGIIKEPKGVRT